MFLNIRSNLWRTPILISTSSQKIISLKESTLMRRKLLNLLNEPNIHLEEESWFYHRRRRLELKSRSLTWSHYALLSEESTFEPCETNTKWTVLRQHGMINIHGIGPLGRLIEMFAEGFLHQGVKRGLNNMEQLLHDHHGVPDSNVPSVNKEDGETHTTTNFHSSGT
ncbi:PRELI domain-containing protein 2-like isoform X2 [Lineus longissimus]|uniref:PRELI domain-containing protein 2-like isoform X2 n=1 Tax=Lineus longissimus TaxID=88925 RepID=UPI002B4F68CB